jgi:hypothetical protein
VAACPDVTTHAWPVPAWETGAPADPAAVAALAFPPDQGQSDEWSRGYVQQ